MTYEVFFREDKEIFTARHFIHQQPETHREVLQAITDALAENGKVDHPLVTQVNRSEWSVFLKDQGGVYVYTLFISQLEHPETAGNMSTEKAQQKRQLVIIDPSGPRDSVGGYHPGYWSVEHYASLLEEIQRKLFLKTINQVKQNIPSDSYSLNNDGTLSIHIRHQEPAYTISVVCSAAWRDV